MHILDDTKSKHVPSTPSKKKKKITIYNELQDGFGLRVVGQVDGAVTVGRVKWVLTGGPAHMAGLRVGDKIFEWDGLPLSTARQTHSNWS